MTPKDALGLQSASCKAPALPIAPITEAPGTGSTSSGGSLGGNVFCANKASGLYLDPADKNAFYSCLNGQTFTQHCQPSLIFDASCACCN
ncbi:hypothetical protein HPG69_000971 [Diceros bicornis minor]|uniref:chitinase n=1 Tax=Diceros bicornis minor TaxID=77932 RepID=A0A7J7E6G9_DICBM|nr:hypothetical protein HPG69_000971 [Diceros bicornis minor]